MGLNELWRRARCQALRLAGLSGQASFSDFIPILAGIALGCAMKKSPLLCLLLALLLLVACAPPLAAHAKDELKKDEPKKDGPRRDESRKDAPKGAELPEEWFIMPAGARPAYFGIHGGTMPVSLLVADDGSNLFTFVGRTGNDFMEVLKKVHTPLPTLGNATWALPGGAKETGLVAGNATASLPVMPFSRANLEGGLAPQPFGLSTEPLSIEGRVMKPAIFPHARSLRVIFRPDFLRPELQKLSSRRIVDRQ